MDDLADALADASLSFVIALTALQDARRRASLPEPCVSATGPAPEVPKPADASAGS